MELNCSELMPNHLNFEREDLVSLRSCPALIGEFHVTITHEVCRQVMFSVRCRLQLCAQSGGQYFEHLCEVANVRFRQREAPTCCCTGPLRALMLAANVLVHYHLRNGDCHCHLNMRSEKIAKFVNKKSCVFHIFFCRF